jgi:hypothetical protein
MTKKEINDQLKRVDDIYRGNIPDRYTGLKLSECSTDLEREFFKLISDEDFAYKNKKQ